MVTNLPIELMDDETTSSLMFYTAQSLVWGEVVHKKAVLPGRLLVGITKPDLITIYNAQVMFSAPNYIAKPIKHPELFIHEHNVLGYHLSPPAEDQLDYDATEPHRMMSPISVHIGTFFVKAQMRISDRTSVKINLDVSKAEFLSFYDAEITHPHNPNMPPIKTNLIYVRLMKAIFAVD